MIRRILAPCMVLIVISCLTTQHAHGDYLIRFSDDNGSTFKTAFTGLVGGTVTVDVYLSQTGVDTILTDEGMFQFHTVAGMDTTLLGSFSSTTINPDWDNPVNNSTATTIDWLADDGINGEFGNDILLGDFVFSLTASGTTTISFGDNSTILDEWITPQATTLDKSIFGASETDTYSLTISAIPEPSAIGFLFLGFAAIGLRRRSKRGH